MAIVGMRRVMGPYQVEEGVFLDSTTFSPAIDPPANPGNLGWGQDGSVAAELSVLRAVLVRQRLVLVV